ncbi:SIMPL domain-containing protein [Chloroflexota bacterium]
MKRRGTIGMLLLGLLIMGVTACGGGGGETTSQQPAGDIIVTITADGNIEASSHERLIFGSGGKVDKIFVEEGDNVNKGDVLARLDTGTLELAEAQAQVALTQAQVALTQAQLALTGRELAILQEETNITNAEIALEIAEDLWLDTLSAGRRVKRTKKYLDYYLSNHPDETEEITAIRQFLREDWERFLEAATDSVESKQVTAKEMELEFAKKSLEYAQQDVNLAQQDVNLAQQNVNLAQQSLDQARENLQEATIVAPFDGMVAKVGAKEGEFLSPVAYTGTTIVEIIDLSHMELTARADELDVVKVKMGQKVMISVDAMPGVKFEAGGDLIRIDSIAFTIDDSSEYYEEARQKAMADARSKAEQLAELADVNLGKPTYIYEGLQIPTPRYASAPEMDGAPGYAVETPISAGEMEISLSLQVAYAIR